jgi:hypothetical protein
MKTLIIALALATPFALPAFTRSANETPHIKSCDGSSQAGYDSDSRYPGYPPTLCYWW